MNKRQPGPDRPPPTPASSGGVLRERPGLIDRYIDAFMVGTLAAFMLMVIVAVLNRYGFIE